MATRRLVQKEAGTIAYTLREIKDFSGNANADNPAVAVSVVGGRTVTSDELAREIAASCTIKEADVVGVLKALSLHVQRTLLDGNRVELGEIGTLSVTLTCGNKHRTDNVKARDIKVSRIAFAPSKELGHAMRGAKMFYAGGTHMKVFSDAEIEERLTAHFATRDTLYRSEMESLCECTRYRAMQLLETLVKVGKLRKAGRQNSRYYIPVEGYFAK